MSSKLQAGRRELWTLRLPVPGMNGNIASWVSPVVLVRPLEDEVAAVQVRTLQRLEIIETGPKVSQRQCKSQQG